MPAEKSGQAEFQLEFGDRYAAHIEDFKPTFVKVLLRYDPEDDEALKRSQSARLKQLSDRPNNMSISTTCPEVRSRRCPTIRFGDRC